MAQHKFDKLQGKESTGKKRRRKSFANCAREKGEERSTGGGIRV
jgi:hypothetical protein